LAPRAGRRNASIRSAHSGPPQRALALGRSWPAPGDRLASPAPASCGEIDGSHPQHPRPGVPSGSARLPACFTSIPKTCGAGAPSSTKKGWTAPPWPKKYVDTARTAVQRYIFDEKCCMADAPLSLMAGHGVTMVGPVLASEAQKAEWLPRLAEGDLRLSLAFAEKWSRFHLNGWLCGRRRRGKARPLGREDSVARRAQRGSADRACAHERRNHRPGRAQPIHG
jgi:Acyl-CoA dehydrogenase, N-terminal domain